MKSVVTFLEWKSFNKFSDNVSPLFPSLMLSIKTSFREKIAHLKSAKKMNSFLNVENASLATTYPDVCRACMMYMTVGLPVTVATEDRSVSKLKLIKNFLQSSMFEERLNSLALLSIENERTKNLDFKKIIFSSSSLMQKQDRKISSFQSPASKLW